nr:PaaI family thioesterase [Sphingomicrobium sediminis]
MLELAGTVGHGKAVGYAYEDHGDDWVAMRLDPHERLVGVEEKGILASGAIVSLLDACGGGAVWNRLGAFRPIATIDLRIDYLRPATLETPVIARCECYKLTKSVAFVRGNASLEGGEELANVAGTYIVKP